jgi:penicillin-binding protein 1A
VIGEGPLLVSNVSRVPRVVQSRRQLPWAQHGTVQATAWSNPDAMAPASRLPMSHPTSNIGDDFIARALADEASREQ